MEDDCQKHILNNANLSLSKAIALAVISHGALFFNAYLITDVVHDLAINFGPLIR